MLASVVALLHVLYVQCTNVEYKEVLAIAGNFSLNGKLTNLAQYDISSGMYEAELYVYGESYGVVWDTSVNRSKPCDELIVVGGFDTVSTASSQVQYCSVGVWTGMTFSKMGEGLCPRGGGASSAMMIQASVLGDHGDLFVGGSFESRVWDGNGFVNIHDVAYFKGSRAAWLPLNGGQLLCNSTRNPGCQSRVSSLAWDPKNSMLFIGGKFDRLDDMKIPGGVCIWTEAQGLTRFPSKGIGFGLSPDMSNGEITHMAYEPTSQSLFVAGLFSYVNNEPCQTVAVWYRISGQWLCLNQEDRSISTVTTMTLDTEQGKLYLAGWASFQANWKGGTWGSPYAISWADINSYIAARTPPSEAPTQLPTQESVHSKPYDRSPIRRVSRKARTVSVPVSSSRDVNEKTRFVNRRTGISSAYQLGRPAINSAGNTTQRLLAKQVLYTEYLHRRILLEESRSVSNYTLSDRQARSRLYQGGGLSMLTAQRIERRALALIYDSKEDDADAATADNDDASHFAAKDPPLQVVWDWLPGFSGGNGPIFGIAVGRHQFFNCLFIAGAFNNGPPIVLWMPSSSEHTEPRVISVGNMDDNIHGLITSVAQLVIAMPRVSPPNPLPIQDDTFSVSTWIMIGLCIFIGILLGILFTVRCSKNPYFRIPTGETDENLGYDGEDEPQVSLEALGGQGDLDLKTCYARAMKARHMTADEALVMIDPGEVILSKIIGEGSFGRVWSGKWRNNAVAVKEFVFAQAALTGGSKHVHSIVEEIIGEAGVMTCLRHPKILQLYGCSLTVQAVWIVCELCDKGSLRMLLNDSTVALSPATKASICLDIADGMMYLHRRKPSIIHRDLKSHNVFVLERSPGRYIAKIGDWGSARAVALSKEKTLTQGVGTACWLAPEVIMHAHYSKESDVYAFGIVLWEVFTRRDVYPRLSAAQIISKVANEGLRPHVPHGCPWEEIMRKCWRRVPEDRPTFGDIIAVLSAIYSQEKAASVGTPDKNVTAGDFQSPCTTPSGPGIVSGRGVEASLRRSAGQNATKYYSS